MSETATENNQSLFNIVTENQKLMAQLLESGGEMSPEMELHLERIGKQLVTKVDNYVGLMDALDAQEQFFKAREKEMQTAKRSMANLRERLKSTVKEAMATLGKEEVVGDCYRLKMVNNPESYDINEGMVPEGYFIETVVKSLDKTRLLEDVKMGLEVDGVTVKNTKRVQKYAASSQKTVKKKTTKKKTGDSKAAKKKTTKKAAKKSTAKEE